MSTPIYIKKEKNFKSNWYSSRYFTEIIHQDIILRNFLKSLLNDRLNNIYIYRKNNKTQILIYYNPPFNVSDRYIMSNLFKNYNITPNLIKNIFYKYNIDLKIIKTATISLDSKGNLKKLNVLKIDNISKFMSKYASYLLKKNIKNRRVFNIIEENIKQLVASISKNHPIMGYGIKCSGPFKRADRAEIKWILDGNLPKNTIKTKSEYTYENVNTSYGSFGVKVWVCYK